MNDAYERRRRTIRSSQQQLHNTQHNLLYAFESVEMKNGREHKRKLNV